MTQVSNLNNCIKNPMRQMCVFGRRIILGFERRLSRFSRQRPFSSRVPTRDTSGLYLYNIIINYDNTIFGCSYLCRTLFEVFICFFTIKKIENLTRRATCTEKKVRLQKTLVTKKIVLLKSVEIFSTLIPV